MTWRARVRPVGALVLAGVWVAACGRGPASPAAPAPPAAPAATCTGTPGQTCFGTNSYVEYAGGDLPVVVSVPHGGALAPASIPDRTVGTSVTDTNTIELGRAVADAWLSRTGRPLHLVICHLRRTKLDANREINEAAQGNPDAMRAWTEYHGFVEMAIGGAMARHGRGFYVDLHGHGHAIQRLELGYLLSSATLGLPDATLNSGGYGAASSLALLLPLSPATFAEVLRGATSLGGRLAPHAPSVPSPAMPSPGADPYFTGGYSTERHTRALPGLQIEAHFTGVRDTSAGRAAFAAALVDALVGFLAAHLGLVF